MQIMTTRIAGGLLFGYNPVVKKGRPQWGVLFAMLRKIISAS